MYRTILVCLESRERAEAVLRLAVKVAERQQGHLIALHVVPNVFANLTTEVSLEYVDQARKEARANAEAIESTFRQIVATAKISSEWRIEEPSGVRGDAVAAGHALAADLVIAGQPGAPDGDGGETVTDALIGSGRPLLLVPYAGQYEGVGKNVMVAWNGTREAARALFDSLPLLKEAERVRILAVDPDRQMSPAGAATADAVVKALGRHAIEADAVRSYSGEISVGDDLLSQLADHGCDLLVMGCYGHSRLREFFFGGVTRHILQHMTVPVLMSR